MRATVGRTSVTGAGRDGAARSVLCVGADPDLRADLVAVCAEAGAGADSGAGRPGLAAWVDAPLVLVSAAEPDLVRDLPRRDGVVLVHRDPRGEDRDPGPDVWRTAVDVGAQQVVVLPLARDWLVDAVRRACRPRGLCVAVVGARGGAGATSTAVALATAGAATGHRVLLVDADPLGGGADLALGAEELPGMRWSDLHDVSGPLPPGGLAAALPVADGVAVLSHGRRGSRVDPAAADVVLRAGTDEFDLVVIDLPRAGDDAAQTMALAADVLLCVCPAEVRAAAAAPAVLAGWPGARQVHLLVRGPAPGGLRPADAAAAVVAGITALHGGGPGRAGRVDQVGEVDQVGQVARAGFGRVDVLRAEPRLPAALERGEAFAVTTRSPLRRWATGWLGDVLDGGGRAVA